MLRLASLQVFVIPVVQWLFRADLAAAGGIRQQIARDMVKETTRVADFGACLGCMQDAGDAFLGNIVNGMDVFALAQQKSPQLLIITKYNINHEIYGAVTRDRLQA